MHFLQYAFVACPLLLASLAPQQAAAASVPAKRGSPTDDRCFAGWTLCTSELAKQEDEYEGLQRIHDVIERDINDTRIQFENLGECGRLHELWLWYHHQPLRVRELQADPSAKTPPKHDYNTAPTSTSTAAKQDNTTVPNNVNPHVTKYCDEQQACEKSLHFKELQMAQQRKKNDVASNLAQEMVARLEQCNYLHGMPSKTPAPKLARRGCHLHLCQERQEHEETQLALDKCNVLKDLIYDRLDTATEQEKRAKAFIKGMGRQNIHDLAPRNIIAPGNRSTSFEDFIEDAELQLHYANLQMESRKKHPKKNKHKHKDDEGDEGDTADGNSNPDTDILQAHWNTCKNDVQKYLNTVRTTYRHIYEGQQEWTGNLTPMKRDVQSPDFENPYPSTVPEEGSLLSRGHHGHEKGKGVSHKRFAICREERNFYRDRYLLDLPQLLDARRDYLAQGWALAITANALGMSAVSAAHKTRTSTAMSTVTHSAVVTHTVTISVTESVQATTTKAQTSKPSSEPVAKTVTVEVAAPPSLEQTSEQTPKLSVEPAAKTVTVEVTAAPSPEPTAW